ncbi:MAG: hypothetical protein O3A96_12380 [Proteobacteria bacterium]|nr:hypothetical protein [Pseudomonadota bacterium]
MTAKPPTEMSQDGPDQGQAFVKPTGRVPMIDMRADFPGLVECHLTYAIDRKTAPAKREIHRPGVEANGLRRSGAANAERNIAAGFEEPLEHPDDRFDTANIRKRIAKTNIRR